METPESIRACLIPGEWVSSIDLKQTIKRLSSYPHPPKLKEVPKVLPQVTSVSVHFPSLRTSHGPSGLYNDCKRGEADGPVEGNQISPVPGRLVDQGPVSGRSTSKHAVVDLTQSLGWIINQEKSELKPTPVFSSWATNTI